MTIEQQNPLSKFFRQPSIYIKLPSGGKWWQENSLELTATGEIPVYPMTTKDEIVLKTPDALLNGQGVVDVIHSCVPSIKNAWEMPSVDVDAVLIAIRIASYGEFMHIETTCSHCQAENDYDIDLKPILGSIQCPDYSKKIQYQTLKMKLHPQRYFAVNQGNRVAFEEQKLTDAINNLSTDMDPDEKIKLLTTSMSKLVELGINSVVESIEYIEMEDGTRISNKQHLKEFFENSESSVIKSVQEQLLEFSGDVSIKPSNMVCGECAKSFDVKIEFDYANFFA